MLFSKLVSVDRLVEQYFAHVRALNTNVWDPAYASKQSLGEVMESIIAQTETIYTDLYAFIEVNDQYLQEHESGMLDDTAHYLNAELKNLRTILSTEFEAVIAKLYSAVLDLGYIDGVTPELMQEVHAKLIKDFPTERVDNVVAVRFLFENKEHLFVHGEIVQAAIKVLAVNIKYCLRLLDCQELFINEVARRLPEKEQQFERVGQKFDEALEQYMSLQQRLNKLAEKIKSDLQ